MIEVIQPGQAGKTLSLFEMHRLRKKIFKDRMQWDVEIAADELEIDDYDLPETVYILARDEESRMTGVWRMLPSTQPSMIRQIWPQFLEEFPLPVDENIWETSRFGVHDYTSELSANSRQNSKTTALLISALIEVCVLAGIKEIYTMYHPLVGRTVRPLGFIPEAVSREFPVDGKPSVVGRFRMDEEALLRVRERTGLVLDLCKEDLPPILLDRAMNIPQIRNKESQNAYAG